MTNDYNDKMHVATALIIVCFTSVCIWIVLKIRELVELQRQHLCALQEQHKSSVAVHEDVDELVRKVSDLKRERDMYEQLYHKSLLSDGSKRPEPSPSAKHVMKRYTKNAEVELRKFEELTLRRIDEVRVDDCGRVPFRVLRANNEECTFEEGSGSVIVKSQAENLVRFVWGRSPERVLLVKKPFDLVCFEALLEIGKHLFDAYNMSVVVEPQVKHEMEHAAATAEFRSTPTSEEVQKNMREAIHRREKLYRARSVELNEEMQTLAKRVSSSVLTWNDDEEQANLLKTVDFVVCLGGDGCLLWVSRLFPCGVPPVCSFAMGSLGFLTPFPYSMNVVASTMTLMRKGFELSLRRRLSVTVSCNGTTMSRAVLNEVIADRGPNHALTNLDCYCNDEFFTKVQADGVIVATPTGSTAYSLSAGGSMVHPEVAVLCFTPICPHSLAFRPLLFSDSCVLRLQVSEEARAGVTLSFDGHDAMELTPGDWFECRMSEYPVPCVCKTRETVDWFRAVKQVLMWNVRAKQKSMRRTQRKRDSSE